MPEVVVALLALQLLVAQVPPAASEPVEPPPLARLTLSSGIAQRSVRWVDAIAQVDTSGLGPAHLRIGAAAFLPTVPLGLAFDGVGDSFRVSGQDVSGNTTSVLLSGLSGSARLAGRWTPLSGLTAELQLGYGVGQAPAIIVFDGSAIGFVVFHHGPVATARLSYQRGWLGVAVQGSASPWALGATADARFSDYAGQVELSVGRLRLGPVQVAGLIDYGVAAWQGSATVRNTQATWLTHRFGAGVQLSLHSARPANTAPVEPPRPTLTRISGVVRAGASGLAIANARVELKGQSMTSTDDEGRFSLELPRGKHHLTVKAPEGGATAELDVEVGVTPLPPLEVSLISATDPGSIRGTLTAADAGVAVTGATVEAAGAPAVTVASDGVFELRRVGPGPVAIKVRKQGFLPVDEVIAVPPGGVATVSFTLTPTAERPLATLRGVIRNTKGAPVRATVTIREVKAVLRAGPDGRFERRVPGGTYSVQIQAAGYVSQLKRVTVADGDDAIFHCELEVTR